MHGVVEGHESREYQHLTARKKKKKQGKISGGITRQKL